MHHFRPRYALTLALLLCSAAGASSQITVTSSLVDERLAAAGTSYDGVIRVRNTTSDAQRVRVYQADLTSPAPGQWRYPAAGTTPHSNGGWVTFASPDLTLTPGEEAPVPFRVDVPADASAGTYWSLMMVEAAGSPPTPTVAETARSPRLGVRQVIRYGVQIVTDVAGPASTDVRFAGAALVSEPEGGVALQIDLENVGERLVRPACWVELFDEGGCSRGRLEGCGGRIFPGASTQHQIDLSHLPGGTYEALVVVETGADEVVGAQYTLEL